MLASCAGICGCELKNACVFEAVTTVGQLSMTCWARSCGLMLGAVVLASFLLFFFFFDRQESRPRECGTTFGLMCGKVKKQTLGQNLYADRFLSLPSPSFFFSFFFCCCRVAPRCSKSQSRSLGFRLRRGL